MVRQDDEEMEVEAGAHRQHLVIQLQILTLSLQKIVLYAMKRYDDLLFDLCFRVFELKYPQRIVFVRSFKFPLKCR